MLSRASTINRPRADLASRLFALYALDLLSGAPGCPHGLSRAPAAAPPTPVTATASGSVTESTASTLAMVATDVEIWARPPAPEVRESVCFRLRRPSSGTEWLQLLLSSVWQLDKATLDGKPVVIERHGSVAFVAIDEDPSASEALLELEMQGSLSKSEGEDRQVVTADSLFLVQQTETKATIIGETIRRSLRKKKGERGK